MTERPNPCGKWHKRVPKFNTQGQTQLYDHILCRGQNTFLVRIPSFENPNRFNLGRTIYRTWKDHVFIHFNQLVHFSHETIFSLQVFKCPFHTLHFKSHLWHLVVLLICELLDIFLATTSQKSWACNSYMQVQALRAAISFNKK